MRHITEKRCLTQLSLIILNRIKEENNECHDNELENSVSEVLKVVFVFVSGLWSKRDSNEKPSIIDISYYVFSSSDFRRTNTSDAINC